MTDKSPDAYRTISEAAEEAGLPAHVLRFWETKFTQLKPVKRKGGRRLYRPQDVLLLKGLRRLLYDEGYTIKGAQKYLRENGVSSVSALGAGEAAPQTPEPASPEPSSMAVRPSEASGHGALSADASALIERALGRLQAARERLDAALKA
jgi:DNA-binding transcriptional MerR regulator